MSDGRWRPVRTADGSWTLAHPGHGETCHSTAGAWLEARERYAAPCRLGAVGETRARVRLLDVGTGLGLNIAAALEALAGSDAVLEVVTLEREPAVIRAGLELPAGEPEAERWLAPVRATLEQALEAPGGPTPLAGGTLELALGDAREQLPALAAERCFDAVFLDPFSRAVEPDLWEEPFLVEVARRLAPGGVLSSYSSSLALRLALARAGLAVGQGPRVGKKASGTLAGRGVTLPPLDPRTARRLTARIGRNPGVAGVDPLSNCLESG
jgi:tRNA U34 5-methylaminomethyl-2-thiouridine-forming methyltransferase MnmC